MEAVVRNWAMVAIVCTLATLLSLPALVMARYVRIALNIMRTTKPPLTRNPLDYEPLAGEPVSFPAYDGLRLSGMIIRAHPGVARRGLILFAHEFCADAQSWARYCRPLRQAGYDIFAFDFRGHGQSASAPGYTPRQWVTNFEVDDMRGALAYARSWLREQDRPERIGVFGVSRGGCAAILMARECPEMVAIACDGLYSTDTSIEYFMRRWAFIFASARIIHEYHPPVFWRFMRWWMMLAARREFQCTFPSVRKALARMTPRPTLFIHGERDSYLSVDHSRRLYVLAGQPKHLWIAPGARHNQAAVLHGEQYARITLAFFDRYLAETPGDPPPRAAASRAASPASDLAHTSAPAPQRLE
jgi:pimeloyl-ACP methyl ester carboxylesterase